ncbi:MAG: hypothetical protein JJV98_04790 [Desulfosarcina sp.]|nr:hypothetical protein [Desulfobacterales bacterium]
MKDAEPLSDEEMRIIHQVAAKFPTEQDVYDAAHREKIWLETDTGALIPYTCAHELTEI